VTGAPLELPTFSEGVNLAARAAPHSEKSPPSENGGRHSTLRDRLCNQAEL
jgi:hypothetical protein